MTSLRKTIQDLQAYVLEQDTAIEQQLAGPDQEYKDIGLGVYQEGYFLRLLEGLSRDFPAVEKLAGEATFEELGREYIRHCPSTHFSIRYIGQHFAKFLSECAGLDPSWSEMAAFEWALENTVDAKDAPQLTFEEMATLSPDSWSGLKFETHPSLETVFFSYAIPALWQNLIQGKEKPALVRVDKPVCWFIWRFNRQSYFRSVDENQLRMLHAIQAGNTFSEVCDGLCEYLEEEKVIAFAAETLRAWISEGLFTRYFF